MRLSGCLYLFVTFGFASASAYSLASGSSSSNNQLLPSALAYNVAFKAFCNGEFPLVCIENVISEDDLAGLRHDASSLRSAGFGAPSGVVSKTSDIRQGVHQIWLQSPGTQPLLNALVGQIDCRRRLVGLVDAIRHELSTHSCRRDVVPEYSELSYLLYDKGSFYNRHVDTSARLTSEGQQRDHHHERCVSLLLYLGDPTFNTFDQRPWDCSLDGGALRIYESDKSSSHDGVMEGDIIDQMSGSCDGFMDIAPNPGTLVLFDSQVVPHEVMTTHRPRSAIVGWFGRTTGISTCT
jgi:Rps23 Pro-64 3,4-dihydroxylase Tpa1-like proline 4-hydroxylase